MAMWKPQTDPCPAPLLAIDLDAATMLFHDLLDDRQSQPDPETLGAEQWLEDSSLDIGRHTRASILEDRLDSAVAFPRLHDEDVFLGTGILYALLNTAPGPGGRRLATLNPLTGTATDIGPLPDGFANIAFVPEPSTLLLLGSALAGLAWWRRGQALTANT